MACCAGEAIEASSEREVRVKSLSTKLLLLGAGESGKSTISKQVKLIYLNGFDEKEKAVFLPSIHSNIFLSLKSLVEAGPKLGVALPETTPALAASLDQPLMSASRIDPDLGQAMAHLWNTRAIQTLYARRSEFQLIDSAKYYLDNLLRITSSDYLPSEMDILRLRIQSTGIVEMSFEIEGHNFLMVDVGGQRSERRKWVRCFEDVTALLFCVGVSEFDQVLLEDGATNRLHESQKLFHEICQSKWFTKTAIMLLLNKSDLFAEKIQAGKSIKLAYPDYNGRDNFQDSIKFIASKFCDVEDPTTRRRKDIYTHVTCATDTGTMRSVFNAIKDFIATKALETGGFIV